MVCEKCGNEVTEGDIFCDYCGDKVQKIPLKQFCENCGGQIEENSKFCSGCGFSVNRTQIKTGKQSNRSHRKGVSWIIVIAMAIILIAGSAAGYLFYYHFIAESEYTEGNEQIQNPLWISNLSARRREKDLIFRQSVVGPMKAI